MKAFILRAIVMALLGASASWAQDLSVTQRASATQDGIEVLTRGPVHEGFAETITFDPERGVVVPKAPPEAIEEVPPDEKPEGDNVSWIPGYWAWDDERDDYLWVSGIWRSLPPGRQWVPGYWARYDDDAQWISGYWADAEASETEYLPEPPATMEVGPNIAAPSIDHRWLPGCWIWRETRYAWRPGYWSMGYQDWTWIPAHYVWTPRGCIFVDGYYDHGVDRRGIVYAPVYFDSRIYTQRRYSYSPSVAISPAVFINHLFLRPSYGHYYFGDYYGANYASTGYSSWSTYSSNQRGYDPFYAQQSWVHRQNKQWGQSVEANFQNYRDNENARPPRTWDDQRTRMASAGDRDRRDVLIAASLPDLVKNQNLGVRFQKLEENDRRQIAKHEQAVNQFKAERQRLEAQVVVARPDPTSRQPRDLPGAKARLPKSPIVAQPMEKVAKEKAPPKRDEAPPPDMKVEPKPRKPRLPSENPVNPKEPRQPNAGQPKRGEPKPERPKVDIPKAGKPNADAPINQPPKRPAPKTEPPKTPVPKDPSPRNPSPGNPSPRNPPPKDPSPKNPAPKDPSPKNPSPKNPAPKPDVPRGNPPKVAPPRQQPPKQPRPKQEPPKGQPPKSDPKEKPKGEDDKPK